MLVYSYYLEGPKFSDRLGVDRIVPFYRVRFSRVIDMFEIFPKWDEFLKCEFLWTDDVSSIIKEIHELISLGSIRYHEKWYPMHTGKYARMVAHRDDRIERRVDLQSRFDRSRSIVGLPCHDRLDEEGVILRLITTRGVDEKYRIVSLLEEVFIETRDFFFCFTEKSSSEGDTDTLFFWEFLCLFWYEEKCDIWNLRTWDFEGIEEPGALLVSHDDEVSLLEELTECHLIFDLFDLE